MHYLKKSLLVLIISLFNQTMCFAFFCPTNFNQINFGDSIDQVTQQCGKPDSQKQSTKTSDNVPQEWTYYIPQTVSINTSQEGQGTLKTTVTFDSSGKAINISVNGIGVGASTICGRSIQLGDMKDAVKTACGTPSFINKQTPPTNDSDGAQQETKVTEFIYNTTPPVTLIFENGQLTDRQ